MVTGMIFKKMMRLETMN